MDLRRATEVGLDWDVLRDALATCARTPMGAGAVGTLAPLPTAEDVTDALDAVDQLLWLESTKAALHVSGVADIRVPLRRASKGESLDAMTLKQVGGAASALIAIKRTLDEHVEEVPALFALGAPIAVDFAIVDDLDRAFDATGKLSADTYPELGSLRKSIDDLHASVRGTLDRMVRGDDMSDILQDRFWTVRDNRYVLPIKSHAKRWDLGIVHDTSGSGQTVFIEPREVVALNNRLRVAEGALAAEEARILAALSRLVGTHAVDLTASIEAAIALDICCARAGLAQHLACTRPIVRTDGVIALKQARHPVLALRAIDSDGVENVVPNDLSLSLAQPALVLTGPNTGGKTVALKTMGLCAMLVRLGCFVPALEGSRCDFFPTILATIGDQQAVHADLSSFSGQLANVTEMLELATPRCLLLLDELCTGTDPAQGGPLARSILEALVERGARIVTTTHYAQLKGLAAVDDRFAVAAMAYRDGRPTYRLIPDSTGESRALATARRLGMDPNVVDRAKHLMGHGEQALSDALAKLDDERTKVLALQEQLDTMTAELAEREKRIAQREDTIATRSRQLEARGAQAYLDRLTAAERAVAAVVADLQRAPDHRKAKAARQTVAAMRGLVPTAPEPEAAPAPRAFALGDRVKLVKLGQVGEVVSAGAGGLQVRVGVMTINAKAKDLELIGGPTPKPVAKRAIRPTHTAPTKKKKKGKSEGSIDLGELVRLPHNTLDMRGMRVDEGQDAADSFFDRAQLDGMESVFLLHGHGTGALKTAMRQWLRSHGAVQRWSPANPDQGGDAYTVVLLS